jgi:urea transporter
MKNLIPVAFIIPFATITILGLIAGAVLTAPFLLVGFLLYQHKKNKRRNNILSLLNKSARAGRESA